MVQGQKMGWTRVVVAVALALFILAPSPAEAIPHLIFDQALNTGTLSYGGEGGPLVGLDIAFSTIQGIDTPLFPGVTIGCTGCMLSFTTGLNLTESATSWSWDGGGTFTIMGGIPAAGIPAGSVILSGTFFSPVTAAKPGGQINISGAGMDTKHDLLAAFFGLENPFEFSQTEITVNPTAVFANFGFDGLNANADMTNTAVTPEPGSFTLIMLGLLGLGLSRSRRR